MNNTLVTTGVIPLAVGSIEQFIASLELDGLPWNLQGGSVNLLMVDPAGVTHTYAANTAGFAPTVNWTVIGPVGTWTRAWDCTDVAGVRQVSLPIVFNVIVSP